MRDDPDPYEGADPKEKLRRVLEYLKENPYSSATEVHKALKMPINFASGFLAALYAAGVLKSKKAGYMKLYAPTDKAMRLLERLQRQA